MKALCLISGGIDSPVATHLMLQKGLDLSFVHFNNWPFTDEKPIEKVKLLLQKLKKNNETFKLYVVPHGQHAQQAILKNCDRHYSCVLCRRMMFRVSEKIAEMDGAEALVTGENLGQVASQTLHNLVAESNTLKIPVLRPLLTYDKQDIINIAREIGTFEPSTMKSMCCNVTPKKPATKSMIEKIESEEKKMDVEKLVSDAVSGVNTIEV